MHHFIFGADIDEYAIYMQLKLIKFIIFIALSYAISWLIWLPLYGPVIGLPHLCLLPFHHALGAFGPSLAAFITLAIFNKRAIYGLLRKTISMGSVLLFSISLLSPFLLYIVSAFICSLYSGAKFNLANLGTSNEFPQWNLATVLLYNLVTFGIGEETGWRGFALPLLQTKYNALTASLLLTLVWAGWHLPLFLYRPGYVDMDLASIAGWVLSLLTGSILLTWLFNSSKGSILLCAIFHATIDVSFTSPVADKLTIPIMGLLISISGILITFIFGYQKLSRSDKVQLEL